MSKKNAPTQEAKPATPRRSSGLLWLVLGLLLGVLGGYFAARHVGLNEAVRHYRQLQSQLDLTVAQSYRDINALQTQLDALEGQLAVEQSTRKSLEVSLETAQSELASTRERLAFFDRLLPPGPNGAVSVRALDIEPHGPNLAYKVLLTRNAPNGGMFEGRLQFTAQGKQDGKAVKVSLEPAKAQTGEAVSVSSAVIDPLAVGFEQFQRSEGLLSLPPDFKPEAITLNVLEGDTVRVSRRINLPAAD